MNTDYINKMVTFKGLEDAMKRISTDVTKIGEANYVTGRRNVGWGHGNQVKGIDLITFGSFNFLTGANSVVLGERNSITNDSSSNLLVLGKNMQVVVDADNDIGVAIGVTKNPSIVVKNNGDINLGNGANPSIAIKNNGDINIVIDHKTGYFDSDDDDTYWLIDSETQNQVQLTESGIYLFTLRETNTYRGDDQTKIIFWTQGTSVTMKFIVDDSSKIIYINPDGEIQGSYGFSPFDLTMEYTLLFSFVDKNNSIIEEG